MTDMTIEEELSITCEQRDALDIECARLEKEVDALRKDAERYRWLRDQNNSEAVEDMIRVYNYGDGAKLLDGEELDAAIDAAMRE